MLRNRRLAYPVVLALAVSAPFILNGAHFREALTFSVIFAILALSMDFIMGHMGQFSFGHQAFFGLGAYTSAILTVKYGLSPWLGFLAAPAFTAALGVCIGFVALMREARGMYLALTTLGFGVVLALIVNHWWSFTGGALGLWGDLSLAIDLPGLPEIRLQSALSYYYFGLALLVFQMYLISRLLNSRFGRALAAIRENEALANSVGISTFKYYIVAFTVGCALAGLAGAAYFQYVGFVNSATLGLGYLFQMFVMVLVGGTGTLLGPVLGALIYTFVSQLLPELAAFRFVLLGAILLLSMVFLPKGLYPGLASALDHLTRRFSGTPKSNTAAL